MAKSKVKEIDWEEMNLYTNIVFASDEGSVVLRNIDLDMLDLFKNRVEILKLIVHRQWYLHGLYENVDINGYIFKIVAKSKNKVELISLGSDID